MKGISLIIGLFISMFVYTQTVQIYCVTPFVSPTANILSVYEVPYGVGNVTITSGATLLDYSLYDVVIFNKLGTGYSLVDVTTLTDYVQNGGHLILSTEGSTVAGGGKFMSTVWNAITGQAITETAAHAPGTGSPPRFHNSNGPWHSSPDPNLNTSTTTYASFANLHPLNVTHQRDLSAPSCGNIEGLSAVFPSKPNLTEGTIYIQGEIQYPFFLSLASSAEVFAHATAVARMHYALLTNNQVLLTQLNTWEANLVVDDDFIGNDILMCSSNFVPFLKTCPPYASYSWEDLEGNILSTSANYMISDSGTYLIRTTGTFPQCDGLDTLHIRFKSTPLSSFSADTVCQGESTVFTNNSAIDAPDIIQTILWDFADGNTDNISAPSHLFETSGTFNVKLTNTSDQQCEHDTTITVVVNPEPTANFSVTDDCLYNNPVFIESSIVGAGSIVNWNWNFGEVLPVTAIQSTSQVPSYVYTQDGSFPVTLIVITDQGCDDTIVKTTVRYPVPEVSFTSVSACKNDSVSFENTSSINAPDYITSWIWNYGDGSPLVPHFDDKHKYVLDGYFNTTLIASSNNGCVSDVTNFIQVYPLPLAEFGSTTTCENGNSTSFFNFSTVSQGSITNYNWVFDDNGATSNSQFANHNYTAAGTYNVELNVESADGCKDTIFHDVVVHPKPEANFIVDIKEGCFPYCSQFQDNSQSNATSITDYFWFFGNGEVHLTQDPKICFDNLSYTNDAIYNASLIVTNDLGCKDTIEESNYITVWPKPLAEFTTDPLETNMYNSLIHFENLSEGGDSYEWDYNDGVQSVVFEEEHQYADTGVFVPQLVTTSINGCTDTTNLLIQITPILSVYIPTAFTPDGDGVNDYFFVEGFAIDFDNFEFLIFDRWGTLIYRTTENMPWDGTYKGEIAPQDTYIYLVSLRGPEGKDKEYEGHFTLLK